MYKRIAKIIFRQVSDSNSLTNPNQIKESMPQTHQMLCIGNIPGRCYNYLTSQLKPFLDTIMLPKSDLEYAPADINSVPYPNRFTPIQIVNSVNAATITYIQDIAFSNDFEENRKYIQSVICVVEFVFYSINPNCDKKTAQDTLEILQGLPLRGKQLTENRSLFVFQNPLSSGDPTSII